ncbi:MAG: phenylacetate--CoA ligase family protein [Clostridia bacterium]|nr:phenylacetate--CoA ligase family protein [Clostridia bacterium]
MYKLIYKLGVFFRNREIPKYYKALKESEKSSLEELEKLQLERCRELVLFAYYHSPFYKRLFDSAGFHPEDLRTLEDLKKIPVVTKDEFMKFKDDIQVKKGFTKLFYSMTSGSTRQHLVIYRNNEWDASHRAAILRGYSWHNVNPWDKNGYFWGFSFSLKERIKVRFLDILQNRFRLFSYDHMNMRLFLKKLTKAKYLEGYSSMIYETAKIINKEKLNLKFNLSMIKGTAEKIYDTYKEEVMKAFGRKIISEYGAMESGIIAFECPYGNMHVTMENVIVEEEENEIIVTNLVSKSFPIIRYKLGDYIKLGQNIKCKCGLAHHIIEEVTGRVGGTVFGYKNQYPSLAVNRVFKNLTKDHSIIVNYRFSQTKKGCVDIYIEQSLTKQQNQILRNELQIYFKNDMEFIIHEGNLNRDYTKKMKEFDTRMDGCAVKNK